MVVHSKPAAVWQTPPKKFQASCKLSMERLVEYSERGAAFSKQRLTTSCAVHAIPQEWYATQNVCPHKRALVLSEGIVGSRDGIMKVACPLHKNNFDLST